MYLILSVAFFLLTTLGGNPGRRDRISIGNDGSGGANLTAQAGGQTRQHPTPRHGRPADGCNGTCVRRADGTRRRSTRQRQRIVDEIVKRMPDPADRAQARAELEKDFGAMTPEQIAPVQRVRGRSLRPENLKIGFGPDGQENRRPGCATPAARSWPTRKGFGRAVYENIPKMMFIFLPLIAAVMFVLYLGSGRYYVEHLLFFVHFHAFFFLGGIAVLLLERLSDDVCADTRRSAA